MATPLKVAIYLFDQAEDLDFAGPLEVFGAFGRPDADGLFEIATVSQKPEPIKTRNGLTIQPAHHFGDCPETDILVVPGGVGTRTEINKPEVAEWVRGKAQTAQHVLSVCTGSLILARAGLLHGLEATTHFMAMDTLAELAPRAVLKPGARFLDNGRIVVAAGVSAGIDAALYLAGRIYGTEMAQKTADYIEYEYYRPTGR